MGSFNYLNNLTLGGLMGNSPYSNVSMLNGVAVRNYQQRYNQMQNQISQQNRQQHPHNRPFNRYTPTAAFLTPLQVQQNSQKTPLKNPGGAAAMTPSKSPPVIKFRLPDHVIQDVLCRFIMNIPEEERFDPVRALFQVELAHWFFIDHYCADEGDPALVGLSHIPFNQFAYIIFKEAPHLRQYYLNVDNYLAEFRSYRSRVPTYGAILMNKNLTQVVLVQGYRNQWGFPKGKVNETEDPIECAIREVYEETGYDMKPLINPNHFIESKTHDRNDRLFLIRGVDPKFPFFPRTQGEIKSISWFNIDEIPEHKKDNNPKIFEHGEPVSNFFTIYPYIKRLKLWIADKVEGKNRIPCFRSKYLPAMEEGRGDEDISFVEENYSFQSTASNFTPSGSQYSSFIASSSTNPNNGEEIIRSVLAGMRISDSNSYQKTPGTEIGNDPNISKNKKKEPRGMKSKKRLFNNENEPGQYAENAGVLSNQKSANNITPTSNNKKDARMAANFISSALGFPVNIGTNNSMNKSKLSTTPRSDQQFPQTSTPLPTAFNTPKKRLQTPGSPVTCSGLKASEKYLTAKSWENFVFDKDKLIKALGMLPPCPELNHPNRQPT